MKEKMDSLLASRLNNLNDQNKLLEHAESAYRLHEAKRKTTEADLFLSIADGGNVAEKQAKVHSNQDYLAFMLELSDLETKFNFEKRRFDILQNAFFAEHSTFKREIGLIQKEGINT